MISFLTAAIAWNANNNHTNAMFLLILNVVNTITKITNILLSANRGKKWTVISTD
jgi:hypothetical protein